MLAFDDCFGLILIAASDIEVGDIVFVPRSSGYKVTEIRWMKDHPDGTQRIKLFSGDDGLGLYLELKPHNLVWVDTARPYTLGHLGRNDQKPLFPSLTKS
jgi:hypothetical protein